jgi:cystathionine beta-lyase family protein involved in aluminum resistance
MAGSLIKNPGGGIAPSGGYIAGKRNLVKLAANRLTSPSTGNETGSYYAGYLPFFQGLFQAPHVVAQAVKGGMLFLKALSQLGYETLPAAGEIFDDIICSVKFQEKEELIKFCQTIQSASPVDSFVLPQAWAMPGYQSEVIMAAGCFVQGSSIELSCDSPIKKPYIAYLQGGLSVEHAKFALCKTLDGLKLSK